MNSTYLPKDENTYSFSPDKTSLLVIDPVNDFLSEGGAAWDLTKKVVEMNNVVANIKQAVEGARQSGIPVFWGPMAFTEEDYANEKLQRKSGINRLMFERKMFLAGSWGADFHPELQPAEGEIILQPHKTSDVFSTDLPEHLQQRGITHIVIAGMAANVCCESTGRHAMEAGYDVTYLSNAIGAASVPEYEAAIHLNYPLLGNAVLTVEEFLSCIRTSSQSNIEINPGDTILGSDHGEIGTIEKIIYGTGEIESYLLVPQGLIFKTDTYIPLNTITKRSGKNVFINIPKLVVHTMPWSKPPLKNDLKEKQGPSAESVEKLYGSYSPSAIGN
ncbi:MAG: cysteine hydrolase [Bacteroidota bacterium]|nr:cysteine hydrolase [Bacteroidota bacterium]